MDIQFSTAIVAGKVTGKVLRLFGRGGGALPGLVSSRIDPQIMRKFAEQSKNHLIIVCGTNGKTTTSRMIATILGTKLVYNRSGSNMTRGHIAAYLEVCGLNGSIGDLPVLLETDEAILPTLLQSMRPTHILVNNLFRDQLDRYGEVDSIAKKWLASFKKSLSNKTVLIVNADDPNLAYITKQLHRSNTLFYGLEDEKVGTTNSTSTVDTYLSPSDGQPLHYSTYYLSHLGNYQASDGFTRPRLNYAAKTIEFLPDNRGCSFVINHGNQIVPLTLNLPGIYNIYNALAATTLALTLTVDVQAISTALLSLESAFGRFERLSIAGKEIILCLIKNPVGATEIIRTIVQDTEEYSLLFCMHDNFADGLDVSWYWDTAYELIQQKPTSIICSGKRSEDIALRIKYAGYIGPVTIIQDLEKAYDAALKNSTKKLYVLSTYTATLELQKILTRQGSKPAYWKE